jgi:hypothetical protein
LDRWELERPVPLFTLFIPGLRGQVPPGDDDGQKLNSFQVQFEVSGRNRQGIGNGEDEEGGRPEGSLPFISTDLEIADRFLPLYPTRYLNITKNMREKTDSHEILLFIPPLRFQSDLNKNLVMIN